MKWLRTLTGALAAAIALLSGFLAVSIYCGWDGAGQMYTPEIIAAKFRIIEIPLLIWLALLLVTAFLELRRPKKPELAAKPKYPEQPAWVRPVALGAAALAGVWILAYLLNMQHFASRDLEPVIKALVVNLLPAAIVLLVSAYFLQREASPKPEKPNAKRVMVLRIVLATLAVVFFVTGIFNGGMRDVLGKAINICTECVGLG